MKQKWDERYGEEGFAYGKEPNDFFRKWLGELEVGSILMPADGEGRNGAYAAQQGWAVTSFDISDAGQTKALQLAAELGVTLKYIVGDLAALQFEKESFDAIGLIYAHFPADKKSVFHAQLLQWLRPGGVVIFEAFSKNNLALKQQDPRVGGPDDIHMLYSVAEIQSDFGGMETLVLAEEQVPLNEGKYHIGTGSVIRFVGRKPLR